MEKPSQVYPNSMGSTQPFMPNILPDPSIKGGSFDELLQNRGIRFIHKVAAQCPNMKALAENNHEPQCPVCDNSGLVYFDKHTKTATPVYREIWGVFANNTLEKLFEVNGVWEVGTAVITFPSEYSILDKDGNTIQADFNTFDQLMCPDFLVRMNDYREYEPTPDDMQAMRYPIHNIEYMFSVTGDTVKQYVVGVDYELVNGEIHWLIKPNYDSINKIGTVLSIVYNANPVFTVSNLLHELRVTQQYDPMTGQKKAIRLPQSVLVKRDFLFNNSELEGH